MSLTPPIFCCEGVDVFPEETPRSIPADPLLVFNRFLGSNTRGPGSGEPSPSGTTTRRHFFSLRRDLSCSGESLLFKIFPLFCVDKLDFPIESPFLLPLRALLFVSSRLRCLTL